MRPSDTAMLRLIALFKLVKAILLIITGIAALKLLHRDAWSTLAGWISVIGLDPGNRLLDAAMDKAELLSPHKIKFLGTGSFLYAGLFLTEGTGLWLQKRWGEWVTIIITGSLIPLEIYEIFHHLTAIKVGVLIINVAILAYLLHHIRTNHPRETPLSATPSHEIQ
ncbi:MAG TPA: DUF2127 domain-containing protein [Candidatus Acidoferrum sp.]|jgi:uncharacterized membrane protein (DUF2068 family)